MANDLSNKENIVLTYIKELLRNQFPNLDTSDQGAFMEMFALPHVKLLTPLLDYADRIKLTQSLDNADNMTTEEMDQLAAGYFFYRLPGQYATGYVTLSFDDIPSNGTIQIPSGAEVQSKQGYNFQSVETLILDENDLSNYYNPDVFLYQIPVFFQAENPGSDYNIEPGDITTIITGISHLTSVTNDIQFTGGVSQESNADLAKRIKTTAGTPNLGVERGWIGFAKGFSDVIDVIPAGFGHPLMKRDVIGTLPPDRIIAGLSPDVHWGGKLDLHIRGNTLQSVTETIQIQRNSANELFVPLNYHPTYDIQQITFSSSRYTDPKLDASFFIVQGFMLMKDENPETMGTLNESSWVIINDSRLNEQDTVTVQYRYNQLIQNMNDSLYTKDNRPPASDVLLKEAKKKIVQGAIIVELASSVGLQQKDKSIIRQRLYNYITQLPLGVELQFSDFTEPIYQYQFDSIDTQVDYISLPSQYLVTDYDNDYLYYCMNQEKRDFLDQVMKSSTYFTQWIPYYQDNVTIYDFFDVMHLLTYQNVAIDAWKTLSFTDHDWGQKVYYLNMAKMMLAYVNSIQRLSPAKWEEQENVYYGLGNLTIYENVTYASTDLQSLVNLFETIANPGTTDRNVDNILHLTIYCSVMMYVMTTDNIGGMTVNDFSNWLINLTKGTPVDYEVNL